MKLLFLFLLIATRTCLFAQEILINGYYNASDVRDEWTELLVIEDNLDIQNYTLNDDNASTDCAQARIRFKFGQRLWQHLRAGTIIVIWHRPCNSSGTSRTYDFDAGDGYIELDATNSTYFDYPDIGTSLCGAITSTTTGTMFSNTPCTTNSGLALNIAIGGELLVLRNASGAIVNGLGHDDSPGTSWNTSVVTNNSKAVMYSNTLATGNSLKISCTKELVAYYGECKDNCYDFSNSFIVMSSTDVLPGVPNTVSSCTSNNSDFWRSIREPLFDTQEITPDAISIITLLFSWESATDVNSTDGSTGYIILRNTADNFIAPTDGTTYTNGNTIGSAKVLEHITSNSYTDTLPSNSSVFYYRVYAYRFGTDITKGNSYHLARGRAYNNTHFVSTNNLIPLPLDNIQLNAFIQNNLVYLNWKADNEVSEESYYVERSNDNTSFKAIYKTQDLGNYHIWNDSRPLKGTSYYRIRKENKEAKPTFSPTVMVEMNEDTELAIQYSINNKQLEIFLNNPEKIKMSWEIFDLNGKMILAKETETSETMVFNLSTYLDGIYVLRERSNKENRTIKFLLK